MSVFDELDNFGWWSLKTVNGGAERHQRGAFRSYCCTIVHKHHRYEATAKTIASAVQLAVMKAQSGHKGRLPKLKLVGGSA